MCLFLRSCFALIICIVSFLAEHKEASENVGTFQCGLPVGRNMLTNNNIITGVSIFIFMAQLKQSIAFWAL